jgi:hypothetical protein
MDISNVQLTQEGKGYRASATVTDGKGVAVAFNLIAANVDGTPVSAFEYAKPDEQGTATVLFRSIRSDWALKDAPVILAARSSLGGGRGQVVTRSSFTVDANGAVA